MKILLATGIFFPDVGGPATHVYNIAERLTNEGYDVTVLTYGNGSDGNFKFSVKYIRRSKWKIIQWFKYFYNCLSIGLKVKVIYAFDPTSAGLPSRIASFLLAKPFVIRIGGDPIWERQAEKGKTSLSLDEYYTSNLHKKNKYILFQLIKFVVKSANIVVVYNNYFKYFYIKYYSVEIQKIVIIKNPVFKREKSENNLNQNPIILFAGRFVKYKNLFTLFEAFNNVRDSLGTGKLVLIGNGPEESNLKIKKNQLKYGQYIEVLNSVSQDKLWDYIKMSSICIAPAISEFNPNFILEAISFGKPVLLSKGHGLTIDLPETFIFDPRNQKEMEEKIKYFFNLDNYKNAVDYINDINVNYTWDQVTSEHLKILKYI